MRTQLMAAVAVILLSAAAVIAQSRTPALIGTWKSAPDELKLATDFDKSVWGPNATSIRTVELIVRSQTEATLRVAKRVVNAKRRRCLHPPGWKRRNCRLEAPNRASLIASSTR